MEKKASPPQKTVCLIDDEIDITSVIRKGLEQEGYIVHAFNDPKKALEHFMQNGKDCTVVISDIRMPGLSGFELCRRVKKSRPQAPVILMTAFEINGSEFDKVMPHTRADGFIQKPVSLKKLEEIISKITSKAQ